MDSQAATEGGPYLGFVGAALRGGPALVRHIRSATIFCTSSYVAVSARNPSRATVLGLDQVQTNSPAGVSTRSTLRCQRVGRCNTPLSTDASTASVMRCGSGMSTYPSAEAPDRRNRPV